MDWTFAWEELAFLGFHGKRTYDVRVSPTRDLQPDERDYIEAARTTAFILYEGKQVAHRSCGIALAETFGLPHTPYQALRRGGITGEGYCGAMLGGELVLGQLLGDPNPAGAVTASLREAIGWYQRQLKQRIDLGRSPDTVCNNLTGQFDDFHGQARANFCTNLAAQVAATVAEALIRFGRKDDRPPIRSVEDIG